MKFKLQHVRSVVPVITNTEELGTCRWTEYDLFWYSNLERWVYLGTFKDKEEATKFAKRVVDDPWYFAYEPETEEFEI